MGKDFVVVVALFIWKNIITVVYIRINNFYCFLLNLVLN